MRTSFELATLTRSCCTVTSALCDCRQLKEPNLSRGFFAQHMFRGFSYFLVDLSKLRRQFSVGKNYDIFVFVVFPLFWAVLSQQQTQKFANVVVIGLRRRYETELSEQFRKVNLVTLYLLNK